MLAGARQGRLSALRKWTAQAMARDLTALVVPGPEVLRALGLSIEAAGLRLAETPRDASVLVVIGPLPDALREAATVAYAQMPRPRAVLALGAHEPASLPPVDISAALSQSALEGAVKSVRSAMSHGAFSSTAEAFDAAVLHASVEYVCPMHPDVVEAQPGSCPKCGMSLVAREVSGSADGPAHKAANEASHHAHQDHEHEGHGATAAPHDHGHHHHDHAHHGHDTSASGTSDRPVVDHAGHEQAGHDHGSMDFMSMIEVTKDLPRSRDGLPMDWIEVPFGPFFPGLPGGLKLKLTLDGDGVARGTAESLVGISEPPRDVRADGFVEILSNRMVLAPASYRLLACRALEQAAGTASNGIEVSNRLGALERERIASHLSWLAQLAQQIGFAWLRRRAAFLQQWVQKSGHQQLMVLRSELQALTRRLRHTPLLESRLANIGRTAMTADLRGPVARAAGCGEDARASEDAYRRLGFEPVVRNGGDAWNRLNVRLAEIEQSLELINAAGALGDPALLSVGDASGEGNAVVETPRGRVALRLTLEHGRVSDAQLDTACTGHIGLVPELVLDRELGDALVAVGSLDLSPWEVVQ